jgi:hypothetical protein
VQARAFCVGDDALNRYSKDQIWRSEPFLYPDKTPAQHCGAYGGLASFKGDAAAEAAHHSAELARAAAYLHGLLPRLKVDCFFVNFEGVWEVPVPELASAVAG